MATDLTTLRAHVRLQLPSTTDWPNATIDSWIAQAIRFYSAQFPKQWYYDLSLTTGTQTYSLPADLHYITAVEYPTGEDPQQFLEPVDEWDSRFQAEGEVYTTIGIDDATAIESLSGAACQIKFAEDVTTGETARIHYLGNHAIPTAGDDDAQITVPEPHWEALVAFVDFLAHAELESDEAVTVSNVSIVLSQLGQEARLKWALFKDVMDRLEWLERGAQSAIVDWSTIGL